jgi:exopolyphosphatase/guanosine-5'-triphosphate,3'-diphosphate pyrophosphatase
MHSSSSQSIHRGHERSVASVLTTRSRSAGRRSRGRLANVDATLPQPEMAAAIDIGSYSVHLLVADVGAGELRSRHDESAHLGLGRTIDAEGSLATALPALLETIAAFAERARRMGAETITIAGTDPLRRATDGAAVVDRIRDAVGLDVAALSHEEEALIALLGVQGGQPVEREMVMVDVGGGSTEILLAGPEREPIAVGLPLGAARLTGVHVEHDPPTASEVGALSAEVAVAMLRAPDSEASQLVAVGGTARNLLRIGPPLPNRMLTQQQIRLALDTMAFSPAATIAERHGVRVSRARVLVAGAAILLGALHRYGLDRLRVSEGGLREGLILAAFHGGPAWRGELHSLTRGWRREVVGR